MYEQYQAQLAEARTEAAQIRAQAQADKAAMVEEARTEAAEAAAAVTARAEASIAAERASTVASLRREVGTLAVSLAGKVVGESLEDDARARATVDRFIADLEAQAAGAGH
jgi:F-type H+-transporting ATPase subunit b